MNTTQSPWRVEISKTPNGEGYCQPVNNDDGRRGPKFKFLASDGFIWANASAENWVQSDPAARLEGVDYTVTDHVVKKAVQS